MPPFPALARELSALCGVRCAGIPARRLAGDGGSDCYEWRCEGCSLFVKVAPAERHIVFEAEAAGLAELAGAHALRVPHVLASGAVEGAAFLALEWIDAATADSSCERRLGEGLAALHGVTAPRFGWHRENSIGRTRQINGWMNEWAEFFRERRLRPQIELAVQRGFGEMLAAPGERLLASIHLLLSGHTPRASLLHGDLWRGNWLTAANGEPVIFDPAVYYGDRETDLAMTRLFGGFGRAFYLAYESVAPLPAGAALRSELYNLYHVLNHANLFGSSYPRQARAMIDRILAALRG